MPVHSALDRLRTPRSRHTAAATLAASGVVAIALGVLPSQPDSGAATADSEPVAWNVKAADLQGNRKPVDDGTAPDTPEQALPATGVPTPGSDATKETKATDDARPGDRSEEAADAGNGDDKDDDKKAAAEAKDDKDGGDAATEEPAESEETAEESEAADDAEPKAADGEQAQPAADQAETSYPDTLDGWIREALAIMDKHDIPGTYDGLYRNIIRESSGDPNAINLWDINAQKGTPSIGLLQVIQPTFDAYHVPGTPHDIYDPVANLCAAANYAADRYGSIDNVDSAY